jgi:hypothetical protein
MSVNSQYMHWSSARGLHPKAYNDGNFAPVAACNLLHEEDETDDGAAWSGAEPRPHRKIGGVLRERSVRENGK